METRVLNIEYHVICKCDNLISPLSIYIYFISFSCLIAMGRASSTILNNSDQKNKKKNSDKNGHHCLLPEFRRKAFSFSPLNIILALILSLMTFIMLRYVSSIPTLMRIFIMNGYWILLMYFSLLRWSCGFSFILLVWCITLIVYVKPSLWPWSKSSLIMVYDLFNVLLDSVC